MTPLHHLQRGYIADAILGVADELLIEVHTVSVETVVHIDALDKLGATAPEAIARTQMAAGGSSQSP